MIKIKKFIPLIIILSLSIAAIIFDLHHYFSFETFKAHQKTFEQFIENNFILSLFVYGAIYIIIVALSLPVATVMTLAGGFLFGQWIGVSIPLCQDSCRVS